MELGEITKQVNKSIRKKLWRNDWHKRHSRLRKKS